MSITPIVAGNWKMNKTPSEGVTFVEECMNMLLDIEKVHVIFCPPFTGLVAIGAASPFSIGAQHCHWEDQGAFTGEISVGMLKDCGVDYVIVGHSERRHVFGETDNWINRKIKAIINADLTPIFCIGETLEQRESGHTNQILERQLRDGLKKVDFVEKLVIAYEPVWAIGSGVTAAVEQVADAHLQVKNILSMQFRDSSIDNLPILYGGSVTPDNAKELISVQGVNGFLIGGASLNINSFISIVRKVEKN